MTRLLPIAMLLLFAGCSGAGFRSSLRTMGDPNVPLSKEGPYAFLPENDIRIEKRLLYERATKYLDSSGFQMAAPERARFLIRVVITTGYSTTLDLETSLRPRVTARPDEELTTFRFLVYRKSDIMNGEWKSVWEATMLADAKDFHAHEEEVFRAVFARLGTSVETRVVIEKAANKSVQPTPGSVTPRASEGTSK